MALEDEYELTGLLTEDCQYVRFTAWRMFQRSLKKFVGKEVLITIRILRYKRSDAQNRYVWGVIVPMVRNWLYETQGEKFTREEVYTWLRIKLLAEAPRVTVIAGEEVLTMGGKRFSQMNTKEFAEAVDTIRERMLERGLDIPEPSQKKRAMHLIEDYIEDT